MKELGEYLKSARIKNGVSLTEVSEDLNLSTALLENIESGNVRAFKDIYELRDNIKKYAKYLGVETNKVNEQFNDFLFEKTSKISLDDIRMAREKEKNKTEEKKKVSSPYTLTYGDKIKPLPIIIFISVVLLLLIIVFLIFSNIDTTPTRVDELFIIKEDIR